MKAITLVLVMIALLVSGCSKNEPSPQEALPEKCVEKKPSIVFDDEQNQVQDGVEWKCHSNGMWWSAFVWKKGKLVGKQVTWYRNGNKEQVAFLNGAAATKLFTWYESGNKRGELDVEDGTFVTWYESGEKEEELNFKDVDDADFERMREQHVKRARNTTGSWTPAAAK